ncbi:uncharacterized protein LOC133794961 [Humulus lupulus]|uniref:uncharacterized protein LOC133794961 n=1 Tax=Humulus lupulus TaxID=3486 RepID=UPI002B40C57C|nr:uncharacterized protein LOC133794961 [Humulus lupulus]
MEIKRQPINNNMCPFFIFSLNFKGALEHLIFFIKKAPSIFSRHLHLSSLLPSGLYLSCYVRMASDGPSWADQWGTGGIGAMEDEDSANAKKESGVNKKGEGKAGLTKAKAAALAGAQKIKSGTSNGFKWIKNQCQKKSTSSK